MRKRIVQLTVLMLGLLRIPAVIAATGVDAQADGVGEGGNFVSVPYSRVYSTSYGGEKPFAAGETRTYDILGAHGVPA